MTQPTPTAPHLLAALTQIREEILQLSPDDFNNAQINLILCIIDGHMPPEFGDAPDKTEEQVQS
jgi:hypothetical protein